MDLTLLQASDAAAVLAFETRHREYFEEWVEPRPAHFYTPAGFAQALRQALLQQARKQVWHYLIWQGQTLAGRASLTQVQHTPTARSAMLSYRIAPEFAGHGLATHAVALLLPQAFERYGLQRLLAAARPQNRAAIQVLLKNGFRACGHVATQPLLHRQWLDVLYFEALQPAAQQAQV